MTQRFFLAYGLVIALGLGAALGNGWKLPSVQPSFPSGGARGSTGSWGWGGGK